MMYKGRNLNSGSDFYAAAMDLMAKGGETNRMDTNMELSNHWPDILSRVDSLVPVSWLSQSVKTLDCLKRIGFRETTLGVEFNDAFFSCVVSNEGLPTHHVVWQGNESAFGEHNVFRLPQETRIFAEFPNWHQFLAGFSFMLTQAQFDSLKQLEFLCGTDIFAAMVAGGRFFRDWDPIKRFISKRDVMEADIEELDQYVRREDSTFDGYYKIWSKINDVTGWSEWGFKRARDLPQEEYDEYMTILKRHRLRDYRMELKQAMPFKAVIKLGIDHRCLNEGVCLEVDFTKRRVVLKWRSRCDVYMSEELDYAVDQTRRQLLSEDARAKIGKRWELIEWLFDKCDIAALCYGDDVTQDIETHPVGNMEIIIKKGRRTLNRFTTGPDIGAEHARALADLIRAVLEDISTMHNFLNGFIDKI